MKKIGTVLGLLAACVFSWAGEGSGQAGAYLKMGVGARALGMGGAFVAIADDATASYWNPAGLAKLQKNQASFMHAQLKLDRNFDFINYIKKTSKDEAFGFSMVRFGVDNIPETRVWRVKADGSLTSDYDTSLNPYYYYDTASGTARAIPVTTTGAFADGSSITADANYDPDWTKEQVESVAGAGDPNSAIQDDLSITDPVKIFSNFDDNENTYMFSWSKALEKLYLGANLKYMTQSLYNADADSIGFDIGLLYDYSKRLTFGLAVRDLMNELKWDTPTSRKDQVPVSTTLGVAYRPEKDWVVALDYNKVENMDSEIYFGTEKKMNDLFSLRMGSNDGDFSAGLSFVNEEWTFEYAYADQDLGKIHRFSTTKTFE